MLSIYICIYSFIFVCPQPPIPNQRKTYYHTGSCMKLRTLFIVLPTVFVCTVLVGHQYLGGVWREPTVIPTGANAPGPIHVGSETQVKAGSLGVSSLLTGGLIATSPIELQSSDPQLLLRDTSANAQDWGLFTGQNNLKIISDRGGTLDPNATPPFEVYSGATVTSDYVKVSNKVRAQAYCDENGYNCQDASSSGDHALSARGPQLRGLSPGQTYVVYVADAPSGTLYYPRVTDCRGRTISPNNPYFWGASSGNIQTYMTHITAPGDGCILGYTNYTSALYIMAFRL